MSQSAPPLTCYDAEDVTYFALRSLYAPHTKDPVSFNSRLFDVFQPVLIAQKVSRQGQASQFGSFVNQ